MQMCLKYTLLAIRMRVSNCKIFYERTGIRLTDVYPSECVILCVSFESKVWLYLYINIHVIW